MILCFVTLTGAGGKARANQAGDYRARGEAAAEDRAGAGDDGNGGKDSCGEGEPRPSPGAGMYDKDKAGLDTP